MVDFPDPLDEAFPLGDGTADASAEVVCPHCGAESVIGLDAGSGSHQAYVEDCTVCCRSWQVIVRYDRDGQARVTLEAL